MIRNIIKEIAGHYNKKVIFNTEFGQVNENTKSFKLGEDVIGEDRYITLARIEEFETHVTVIELKVTTINNKKFLELNPER
jgi:hypothetical protein